MEGITGSWPTACVRPKPLPGGLRIRHDHAVIPSKARVRESVWTVLIALAVIGVAAWLFMAGRNPDSASREDTAALIQTEGIPLPLPIRLPAGYEASDHYSTSTDEAGIAYTRATRFHPSGVQAPRDAPVVVLCAQGVDAPSQPCAPPPTMEHVERLVGSTLVVMWAEYPQEASLGRWKSLELTTDLDEVTWLR